MGWGIPHWAVFPPSYYKALHIWRMLSIALRHLGISPGRSVMSEDGSGMLHHHDTSLGVPCVTSLCPSG